VLLSASILIAHGLRAQFAAPVPKAPKALQPPSDQAVVLSLEGKGSQIYVCQDTGDMYAWKLKGPDAKLFGESGEVVGRHFKGPTWEANDGSRVTGKLVASVPSPDSKSIPWLLLQAAAHEGKGLMSGIQSIQRLGTKGGVAPAVTCSARNKDKEVSVLYQAYYYFYGEPSPGMHAH
jgi:hypothetical protein